MNESRIYTIADIAEMCNVSKATVSRVVNNKSEGVGAETRKLIQDKIKQFNYRPSSIARSIATSHSRMVGLIIPDASNLFYPSIIKGVCDSLEENGYSMILANSDSDPQKEAELLMSMVDMRVEGVILCSGVSNKKFLSGYHKYNIPLVAIGRTFDTDYSQASISGNNFTGAQIAARHLLEGGNAHIYYIDGAPDYSGVMQKREGFITAMTEDGRGFSENHMFTGDFSFEYGFNTVENLIQQKRPISAIFAGSDLIAVGVVNALTAYKRKVPEEVEVVGYDDIVLSQMIRPQLTTIHKPHDSMARRAVEMLLQVISGDIGDLCHITVEPKLVVRETTRPR